MRQRGGFLHFSSPLTIVLPPRRRHVSGAPGCGLLPLLAARRCCPPNIEKASLGRLNVRKIQIRKKHDKIRILEKHRFKGRKGQL
ncbi:MAG: hypothetical protein K6G08_08120 [Prevotella sp.]|nr:hypothetical protein [Prevotella sp.]